MKKTTIKSLVFAVLMGALVTSCQQDDPTITPDDSAAVSRSSSQIIPGQYIVVYNTDRTGHAGRLFRGNRASSERFVREKTSEIFQSNNLKESPLIQVFSQTINGVALNLSDRDLALLKQDPRVAYIEEDKIIILSPPKVSAKPGGTVPQETPWGITRVNGVSNYTGSNVAWIIDTGVDLDHPDLDVDVSRSVSFITWGGPGAASPEDEHGHGSHVAGTIAAINNSIGVIGVAPGASVVAVKVLDRRGSGSVSSVVAGVDYVGSNGTRGDVANMSLGGDVSQAIDDAVVAASANGIKFCLAAGNDADDANNYSPARANGPNIFTISAMRQGDTWASFSNFGNPPIDYCAPGVLIKSTWKNGGYNTISGTSMATPHAAGVLLLGSARASGTVSGDPDGDPDTIISH